MSGLNRFDANERWLPDASHARDLARIYGATEPKREELEELGWPSTVIG